MVAPPQVLDQLPMGKPIQLSEVGVVVNKNYVQYHIVAQQLLDLQLWINKQISLNKEK